MLDAHLLEAGYDIRTTKELSGRAQVAWHRELDLTIRLIKPPFGLGFTDAILEKNVDY